MTSDFTLHVNGKQHRVNADPDMPLLYALRNDIGLNNPKFGCGLAQCGACTVHIDGQPVRSCVTPVSDAANRKIVTLAGLGTVAHDCGQIINQDGLVKCIEGNIVQVISRTLWEETTFDKQAVTSVDWITYPILDIGETPETIDCVLINRPEAAPTGAGEPSIRPVAAAIANAIFDATGVRIRRVPFSPDRVKAALS